MSCESWSQTNSRREKWFAKTLNNIGIVVNEDAGDNHRDLGVTDAKLKSMLSKISDFNDDKTKCGSYEELHCLINNANMADKYDPALGLELGLDLLFQGDSFYHDDIVSLLIKAYSSLKRDKFIDILKAHLEERTKGDKVSLLD